MNRKERVAQHLREATEHFVSGGFSGNEASLETSEIARALHLDRTNVSKLLNELWNSGQAVKIQGRPTLYLSYRVLETALPGCFIPSTIAGLEELRQLRGKPREQEEPARHEGDTVADSLRRPLQRALAACSYPPYGLPLLLVSSSQEDAETFVHYIFSRLKGERPAGAQLITVDCRGSQQGDSSFLHRLFGCSREVSANTRSIKSCFELSAHGMVYLEGVHRLPEHILEMLLSAIDRCSYCRLGETAPRPLDTTLVLSLPPQSGEALLHRLNKHVPCIQEIPSLDSRGINEKLTLLLDTLNQEAGVIGLPLRVGKHALAYLLTARYPAGIGELRSVIRLLCSTVLRESRADGEEHLSISCRHLPQHIITDAEARPQDLARVTRLLSLVPNDYLFFFPNSPNEALRLMQNIYLRTGSLDALPDEEIFFPGAQRLLTPDAYVADLLRYLRQCQNERIAQLQKWIPHYILQNAAKRLAQSPDSAVLANDPALLLGLLLPMLLLSLRRQHLPVPAGTLPAPAPEDAALCRDLFATLGAEDFPLSYEEISFFSAYLASARRLACPRSAALLILCHGQSIASQYAEFLRKGCGESLSVAGLDFPEGEDLTSLSDRAVATARALHRGGGLVVAADLPSLLSISRTISEQTGIACKPVGDISLAALLTLAEQCAAGLELSHISLSSMPGPASVQSAFSDQRDPFMRRYLQESFAPDLTFLDAPKAARLLSSALSGILKDLSIPYTHEVAVKFLAHTSHMLERVISCHPMNYPNLRRFLAENRTIVTAVERRLEPVANTFGITVPAGEIAYVAEIFCQYA